MTKLSILSICLASFALLAAAAIAKSDSKTSPALKARLFKRQAARNAKPVAGGEVASNPAGQPATGSKFGNLRDKQKTFIDDVAKKMVAKMDLSKVFANKDICPTMEGFTLEMCQQAGSNPSFFIWLKQMRERAIVKQLEEQTARQLQSRLLNWHLNNGKIDPAAILAKANGVKRSFNMF